MSLTPPSRGLDGVETSATIGRYPVWYPKIAKPNGLERKATSKSNPSNNQSIAYPIPKTIPIGYGGEEDRGRPRSSGNAQNELASV